MASQACSEPYTAIYRFTRQRLIANGNSGAHGCRYPERRKLGIVFQDFQLLTDRSIADNLSFVLKATGWKDKKKMDERICEVLEKVGMAENKNKMPYQISGGEQQRVAIARALLNDPEVILQTSRRAIWTLLPRRRSSFC